MLSKPSPPLTSPLPNYENVAQQMTQGQFRAAAAQAKVATIPDEPLPQENGHHHPHPLEPDPLPQHSTYMPMGLRKAVSHTASIPLATSSPSGIPRYTPSVK